MNDSDGGADLAIPVTTDLATAGADLAGADLTVLPDLTTQDLSLADLTPLPDLTPPRDLTGVVQDFTVLPDFASLPDLAATDLSGGFDMRFMLPDLAGIDLSQPDLASNDLLASCANGVRDGMETDVDCGGPVCGGCADGKTCFAARDCASGLCLNVKCATPGMNKVVLGAPTSYLAGFLPARVALADLDGDGDLDVVTANQGMFNAKSDVSVLLGNGNGTLAAQAKYAVGFSPTSLAVAPIDNNGSPDVAVASQGGGNNLGSVEVLLTGANGVLGAAKSVTQQVGSPTAIGIGDMTGDAKADLVVGVTQQGKAGFGETRAGNADGTFGNTTNFSGGFRPFDIEIADFNGDGKRDVVAANAGDPGAGGAATAIINLGNGDGTYLLGKTLQGAGVKTLASGDFNKDGKLDLAILCSIANAPTLVVMLGAGDGTFPMSVPKTLGGSDFRDVALADFDKDGILDAAVIFASGSLVILRGAGDGSFAATDGFAVLPAMSGSSLAAGDLDKDGRVDVVLTDLIGGKVVVVKNLTP